MKKMAVIGIISLTCFLFADFSNSSLVSAGEVNIGENLAKGVVNTGFGALAECITSQAREVSNGGGILGFVKGVLNIPANAVERTAVGAATIYKSPTENTELTWPWSLEKPLGD